MFRFVLTASGAVLFSLCGLCMQAGAADSDYPATLTVMPNPSSDAAKSDPDHIVCVLGDAPTGSRIGASRVCRTEAEWRILRREERRELTNLQIQRGDQFHRFVQPAISVGTHCGTPCNF